MAEDEKRQQTEALTREFPKGTLIWYPFQPGKKALCVTAKLPGLEEVPLAELLQEKGLTVVSVQAEQLAEAFFTQKHDQTYDYIAGIGILETCADSPQLLRNLKKLLRKEGILLLGTDNRLGLRYFCGDRDSYTDRVFDGVEHYRNVSCQDMARGRSFARVELNQMLDDAGFTCRKRYSVFPGLACPQLIFAEGYYPRENLGLRLTPRYGHPESVFLEEEFLYADLVNNRTLHEYANAYLFECRVEPASDASVPDFAAANQVTLSLDRGRKRALATVIRSDGKVEKRALFAEGREHLQKLAENEADLAQHKVPVIGAVMEQDAYVMPYVNADTAQVFLQNLLKRDQEQFIKEMDHFREYILQSSEPVTTKDENMPEQQCYRKVYIDLVPLNAFYVNGEYLFYDQEFCMENYPVNVLMMRMVDLIYRGRPDLEKLLSREFFLRRYGLEKDRELLMQYSNLFMAWLRNSELLETFRRDTERNTLLTVANRRRMNWAEEEYQRVFVNLFEGLEQKTLYIFGSGTYARKFAALFRGEVQIKSFLDNDVRRQGEFVDGIPVCAPDELLKLDSESYKVIVCIKDYAGVLRQLRRMGVRHYGVYHPDYERPHRNPGKAVEEAGGTQITKKYHVGYIAGVFDLFHIGHLNLLRRAKEHCDHLIVGVVTDEGVRKNKHVEPFIPFAERMQMVQACRYVDEAVEIPVIYCDTEDAYRKFHFDVQFSGSDYEQNKRWLEKRDFLRKHGAEMIFFPYTQTTSSTKIKGLIDKGLI